MTVPVCAVEVTVAVEAVDRAIVGCLAYVDRYTSPSPDYRYGWEFCALAADVAHRLAEVRAVLVAGDDQ